MYIAKSDEHTGLGRLQRPRHTTMQPGASHDLWGAASHRVVGGRLAADAPRGDRPRQQKARSRRAPWCWPAVGRPRSPPSRSADATSSHLRECALRPTCSQRRARQVIPPARPQAALIGHPSDFPPCSDEIAGHHPQGTKKPPEGGLLTRCDGITAAPSRRQGRRPCSQPSSATPTSSACC